MANRQGGVLTKGEIVGLVILALSVAVAALAYPAMPEPMTSHWNASGVADGTSSRLLMLLLTPVLIAVVWVLFLVVPRIDPLKKNIAGFRGVVDWLNIVVLSFLLLLEAQVILWNLGSKLAPWSTMPVALGLLFFFVGLLLGKTRRNYFIGIRTPWTLASDIVWDKTHRLGSRLFMVSGAVTLAGVFFGRYAFAFILVPVLVSVVVTAVYSYVEHTRLPPG